jgi:hypothetical protein
MEGYGTNPTVLAAGKLMTAYWRADKDALALPIAGKHVALLGKQRLHPIDHRAHAGGCFSTLRPRRAG